MQVYVGLDVSDTSTHMCVTEGSGATVWSGARDPAPTRENSPQNASRGTRSATARPTPAQPVRVPSLYG